MHDPVVANLANELHVLCTQKRDMYAYIGDHKLMTRAKFSLYNNHIALPTGLSYTYMHIHHTIVP